MGDFAGHRYGAICRHEIAEAYRAAAKGHAVNGNKAEAKRLRKLARAIEHRDGWKR